MDITEILIQQLKESAQKADMTNKHLSKIYEKLENIDKIATPVTRYDRFNEPLPTAESGLLAGSVTSTLNPSYLRIYICISVVGVLSVARTRYKTLVTESLNSGAALVAGAAYLFTVSWRQDDYINLRYSVAGGTINRLLVDELGG